MQASTKKAKPRGGLIVSIIVLALGITLLIVYLAREKEDAQTAAEAGSFEKPQATESDVAKPTPEAAIQAAPIEPVFDITKRPDGPPIDSYQSYVAWMKEHTDQVEKFLEPKWRRAQWALQWSQYPDFTHDRILQGFLRTPREYFVREENIEKAYAHAYLPIGWGQTISGPHIVARMTDAINPQPDHRVLEIGTGSGYQSAFLAELSNFVYTIEIIEPLAQVTDEIYKSHYQDYPQYKNITRKIDDGYYGWEKFAPFDRIIVTAGIDHIPPPLLQQLAPNGIMVIPVGPPSGQKILAITKRIESDGTVTLEREDIYEGTGIDTDIFVPFTNKGGGVHSQSS